MRLNREADRAYDALRREKRRLGLTQQGVRERVNRTELSEPPVWRRGPRSQIAAGRLACYLHTSKWPLQQVSKGVVIECNEERGVYFLKELPSGKTVCISISRVFTEPWVARKELMLLQKVAKEVASAKSMSYTQPLHGGRSTGVVNVGAELAQARLVGRIAKEAQAVEVQNG